MNKKICFVVHRYAPYPGGSEYYVQQMAEECVQRHLDVTVVAGEHKGPFNGVRVTSDPNELMDKDLVVVHGGDVSVQNFVLEHAQQINSPILYMLIKPSESPTCLKGLRECKFIGCSAPEDWDHVKKWMMQGKSHKVIHGISPTDCIGTAGRFKDKYNIPKDKRMFLSCKDIKDAIVDADCYVMNSSEEGFGLVILESMINKTPWISRNIAGAKLLSRYGTVYDTEEQLTEILKTWKPDDFTTALAYKHVLQNHLIKNTVDDILSLI